MNALFIEDGQMDKRVFLATWKEIPAQNEVQYTISNSVHNTGLLIANSRNYKIIIFLSLFIPLADAVVQKMQQNNVFTIAKRNVEGQDMLYQSLKLTNGIWVLIELKIQPGNPIITVY